jgi:hypothetical protein
MHHEDTRRILFGTPEPTPERIPVAVGDISFAIIGGVVRRIAWRGIELVRAIDCPVRDESWGTYAQTDVRETLAHEGEGADAVARYARSFRVADGALSGRLEIAARADSLDATLTLEAHRDFSANRAGFTLLHPIAGIAGAPLEIRHPDGSREAGRFPERISPTQPARDIAGLSYASGGAAVDLAFEGEVFEMEDQRNWADASFKTYCRPLALPYPYTIAAGTRVTQRIAARFSASAATAQEARPAPAAASPAAAGGPDLLVAVEDGWFSPADETALAEIAPRAFLARIGAGETGAEAWLGALADRIRATGAGLDLEVVVPKGADPARHCGAVAERLSERGLRPARVIALPEPYLASYQPEGPWPDGPSPEDCARAAADAFPGADIGVGMLTNFTELNRRPPQGDLGAYLTHAACALVHAADDLSVLETLETLPQIFASARALGGDRGYRLGLVSIGMRSNPYGADVAANPARTRRAMARIDPRQDGVFAAAYAVAAYAAAAQGNVEAIALAAPSGPFGIIDGSGARRPIHAALAALGRFQGRPVAPVEGLGEGLVGLVTAGPDRRRALIANPTLEPRALALPAGAGFTVLAGEGRRDSLGPLAVVEADWNGDG